MFIKQMCLVFLVWTYNRQTVGSVILPNGSFDGFQPVTKNLMECVWKIDGRSQKWKVDSLLSPSLYVAIFQ